MSGADKLAATILDFERSYPAAARARAEALAEALVADALLRGIDPREYAAERMASVAASSTPKDRRTTTSPALTSR